MSAPSSELTRRRFLAGAGAAAVVGLAACSGDESTSGTASGSDTTASADGTRTVEHALGTSEVPLQLRRVLAMENRRDLETAVVLGLPVVAVGAYAAADQAVAPFIPLEADQVEVIDTANPNLERIAAIDADLILAREIFLEEDFLGGNLPEIAPVVPIAAEGPWRPDLEKVAGWLDRSATLGAALDQYETMLREVGERHADALASAKVAIVEWFPTDATFYGGSIDGFQLQANTLGELGGSLIDFQADRDYFDDAFSVEYLGELAAADAILLVLPTEQAGAELDALTQWTQLPAIAEGRLVRTDPRTNQGSVYAATESVRLLDELYGTIG
jgi:iron complex transport system substrate-binding protein